MKRSLIIRQENGTVNLISFVGGATTHSTLTTPRKTESKEREIYREAMSRSRLNSFVRSL